uniref:Disks large homolog 5 N-terminal domain-containing protein n=1 Tax=Rattus norvegicus TaxID=10116 RepID=A0A8I5ZNM3_RAT
DSGGVSKGDSTLKFPGKKPRPALPGDLEAWSSWGPLAQPPVWSPGTASSKQQAGRAAAPEQQNQGFGRKASSQNVISKQEECLKELEELKFEIQKCQFERDEFYQILDLYIYDDWDHRLDVELPVLQSTHEMRMMAMQMMTSSISEAMERYKELIQVNSSYRIRHSQLLREQTQLKNNIQILLNENRELLVEQTERPASCVEAKRLCEEAGMNICVPSAKEQQV